MRRVLLPIAALLVAVLWLPSSRAEDARVLMLGNSYVQMGSMDERLAPAFADTVPAWSEVVVQRISPGGYTLAQHAMQADGSNGDTPTRQALVTGPDADSWDWVVLQDQSQTPGFPETELMWMASRSGAITLHELITAGGGETVFLLTWGRRDGDAQNPELYPDFSTMQQRLTDGYLAYIEAVEEDGRPRAWLAPAGLAFQRIHDDLVAAGEDPTVGDTAFTRLYTDDGSHPSASGSYLAALTIAASLTGRPVTGVSALPDVDAGEVAYVQQVATDVVRDDPFGAVPYRWAFAWADWPSPSDTGLDGVVISDPVTWPAVNLAGGTSATADVLSLGATHDGGARGAGSLWFSGGSLTVAGDLTLGAGGDGELVFLASPEREVPLTVAGAATLAGAVRVRLDGDAAWGEAGEQTLVQAASIDAGGMAGELPDGFDLQVVEDGDGARLVLAWGSAGDDDDDATGDDDDASADDDGSPGPGDGGCQCGCGSRRGAAALACLLPAVVVLARRRRWGLPVIGALACCLLAGPAAGDEGTTACVQLTIEKVRSDRGQVIVAFFDDAEAYEENRAGTRSERVSAAVGSVEIRACGLAPGRYGLSVFHDEDDDGALDTARIGIPTEGYGFSRGARGRTGKPSFDRISFELTAGQADHVETIRLLYYL
jgi:uncharacterized protein (DUF2141 family)